MGKSQSSALFVIVALAMDCGDNARSGGADSLGGEPDTGADTVTRGEPSGPPPRYRDPAWVEPAGPTPSEVTTALSAVHADAELRLGAAVAEPLRADVAQRGPRLAAQGYAAALHFDAARFTLSDASAGEPGPGTLGALAALECLVETPDFHRAATLARAEVARLGDVTGAPVARRRLLASAWNNLGRALLGTGEAAGAVFAYRKAVSLFPMDPAYATGLAASLGAADLIIPARLVARRAVALEALADPMLGREADRSTPARAWASHLETRMGAGAVRPVAGREPARKADEAGAAAFPAVGSSIAGMKVISRDAEGLFTVTAPPFEPHGAGHLSAAVPCEINESGSLARFTCGTASGEAEHTAWIPLPKATAVGTPRLSEAGLTCDNAIDRLFSPEPRAMTFMAFGAPGEVDAATVGLARALADELASIEASVGVPGFDTVYVELCSDLMSGGDAWTENLDAVLKRCDGCLCGVTDGCEACWVDYRGRCDALFRTATELSVREEARALLDDDINQQNLATYFAMMTMIRASVSPDGVCGAACGEATRDDPRWAWAELMGGRPPGWLEALRRAPVRAYFACLNAIPDDCDEATSGGKPGADPDKVLCICLGAGPLNYCLQADGGVSLTLDAGLSFGVKGNIEAGASSIRVGVGAGLSASLGPATAGVSYMAWFDPMRGTFAAHDASADLSAAIPGGGSVGSAFECDAWRSDAPDRNSADDELTLEVTVPEP